MPKETSEEVAKIAGQYADVTPEELLEDLGTQLAAGAVNLHTYLFMLAKDIRTLAASALSQRSDAGED